MRKFNAIIHYDDNGNLVEPSGSTQARYMWFTIINGQVTNENGGILTRQELTKYFLATDLDAKNTRLQLYPFTDLGNSDQDYGVCIVHVEEWTCPICSTHNRHVDYCPAPPAASICRHCKTHLTDKDIEEFAGVCLLEVDLNAMTSKVVKK